MKVDEKLLKETIDEYNNSKIFIKENMNNLPTTTINGGQYIIVDMSYQDFIKEKKGIDMDDIKWT